MNNKVEYPVKLMLDEQKKPFFPFTTINSVLISGTDKTAADLFNERYTKDEVDQIIKDLGTLQRLCGRVNSYADLLKIKDPKPGDTYLVGPTAENNSEYMYIGDEWEELGPMIDLSVYYLKEEVDALLRKLDEKLTEAMIDGDVEHLNVAKGLIEQINIRLGDNINLQTENKSTIVDAINEVNTKLLEGLERVLQESRSYTDTQLSLIKIPKTESVIIKSSDWKKSSEVNVYEATMSVPIIQAQSDVIVTPAPISLSIYQSLAIAASATGNGTITFTTGEDLTDITVPDIYINMVVL